MDRALAEVRRVAREQHGCVTVGQCLARGLSRKRVAGLVRAGHWTRMHRGVYLTSSSIPTWRERASAALLYAGRGAALSHRAAGYLHGFLAEPPRVIEVSIPEKRRVEPSRGMRVVRRRPVPEAHGRLRTINRADTVVDLVAAARTTDDAFAIVARALGGGVASAHVRDAAAARSRLRHRRLLDDLLAEADSGIESPLERRYHHGVERAHGLPRALLQVRTVLGGRLTRADRLYARLGLRVELDGQLAHPGGRTDRDVWRDNAAALERSELTLRFRWSHVVCTPCETAAQVVLALRRKGWRGRPRPCSPTCPVT